MDYISVERKQDTFNTNNTFLKEDVRTDVFVRIICNWQRVNTD